MHILAHSHINLQEDDDKGKMAKYLKHLMHDGSFEERLVRNAHVLVDRYAAIILHSGWYMCIN